MAIKFLTKYEFVNLPPGAVVWNRKGIGSQLWEPSNRSKEELEAGVGLWYQLGWKDTQFIEVPLEYVEKKRVAKDGFLRIDVDWKKSGVGKWKVLNFKKAIERFCKDKKLFIIR